MDNSTEAAREMSESFVWTTSIPNRTPTLIIVSSTLLIITTCFFIARTRVRSMIRQWGWDDVMASLAYLIMVIQTSFLFVAAQHGFGKHRADIPMIFSTAMFWFWLYQILYKILGGLTKMTFCMLYLRLFPQRVYRWWTIGVSVVVVLGSFSFAMGTIFQCDPIARNWNKTLPGNCVNFGVFWYSHATFNTVMDIVVFILPMPGIRGLNMNTRSRLGLASIFMLGAFTIVASIVRMTALYGSASSQTDPTWGSTRALIWTEVEANTAVICCCLPALRKVTIQLFRRMLGKFIGPETPSTNTNGQSKSTPAPKPFGTYAEARHSSPGSFDKSTRDPWTPGSSSARWGRFRWPDFLRTRLSDIGEESSRRTEEGNSSPGIELGRIHRRRDFRVESETVPVPEPEERRENVFLMSLDQVLAMGPPRTGR